MSDAPILPHQRAAIERVLADQAPRVVEDVQRPTLTFAEVKALAVPGRGRKRKALDVPAIVRAYQSGEGPTSIGRRYGVTAQTIRNRLRDAGVQLRPGGARLSLEVRAAELDISDWHLDDLVHEVASREASAVNNSGVAGQIAYLLAHMGFPETLRAINEAGGAR